MPLPMPGTTAPDAVLNGPPPSPALTMGASPGPSLDPAQGLGALVPKAITSAALPPEVLTGMMQRGEAISNDLDAFAQMAPDLAAKIAIVKEMWLRVLADLAAAGAGPTSATATGPNFPGGGIDRGGMAAVAGSA